MKAGSTIIRPAAQLIQYFKDSWQELGKITWPSRQQTLRLTVAVIIFSVVFAVVSGFFDFGLTGLIERIIGEPTTPSAPVSPPANNLPAQGF